MFDRPSFGLELDQRLRHSAGEALFGLDVLAGLVDGIAATQQQQTVAGDYGVGVLGCAMAMDDPELIALLREINSACIVITKQEHRRRTKPAWEKLNQLAREQGIAQAAFPELVELAAHVDGRPQIIGPTWRPGSDVAAVREVGFRRVGDRLVPIVHAKLVLLGRMWWNDDHPSGHSLETIGFRPERLRIGSANFTKSSRSNLEVGLWTDDHDLIGAARRFLLELIACRSRSGASPMFSIRSCCRSSTTTRASSKR